MSKHYDGMTADARALTAYLKLLRAGEGVLHESSRLLSVYDLTPVEFGVLESLYQTGAQPVSALARGVLETSAHLGAVVERLCKRRLVRHQARGRAPKSVAVALTPKGRNMVRSILPGHGAAIVAVMARLSPREQETLGRLCQKLVRLPASHAAKPAVRKRNRASLHGR